MALSWPTGIHRLYVPKTFLRDASDEVISAVLAHELGHLIQMPGLFLFFLGTIVSLIKVFYFVGLGLLIGFLPWWMIVFAIAIHSLIINLLIAIPFKTMENDADEFSVRLGHREGMVSFLEDLKTDGIRVNFVLNKPIKNRIEWIKSL